MLAISSEVRDSPRSHARSAKRAAWAASYAAISAVVLALLSIGLNLYVVLQGAPAGSDSAVQTDIADLQQDTAYLRTQLLQQREELATYQLTVDELRLLSRQMAAASSPTPTVLATPVATSVVTPTTVPLTRSDALDDSAISLLGG